MKKELKRIEELILRVQRGSASEEERERLESWRRESARNSRFHRDFVTLLNEAEVVGRQAAATIAIPTKDELFALAAVEDGDEMGQAARRRGWGFRRRVASVLLAAAVVSGLALSLWVLLSPAPESFVLGSGEIVTGIGESTTVTLGDGTVVRLAPRSRLVISERKDAREVWLSGRAYFAVRHMDGIPFRVRTHTGDALVLGTRFDIETSDEGLRVMVIEGAVRLQGPVGTAGEMQIEANQVGELSGSTAPTLENVDPEFLDQELGWLGEFLAFEATPLSQVAQELERRYGVPVQVLDSTLARETVRGFFIDDSLDQVVDVVCRALAADCSVRPTGVTISP